MIDIFCESDNNNNSFECIIRLIESVNCVEVVVVVSNQKRIRVNERRLMSSPLDFQLHLQITTTQIQSLPIQY